MELWRQKIRYAFCRRDQPLRSGEMHHVRGALARGWARWTPRRQRGARVEKLSFHDFIFGLRVRFRAGGKEVVVP